MGLKMEIEDENLSLRELYNRAEASRRRAEGASSTSAAQRDIEQSIAAYERCVRVANEISLFSSNESLDDVSSRNLEYFLLHFRLGELTVKLGGSNNAARKEALVRSGAEFEKFLKLVDSYDLLSKDDANTFERYRDDALAFSTVSTSDGAARRQAKINKFRQEKELKAKLQELQRDPTALQGDETALRTLYLTHISLAVQQAFAHLESIAQELQILKLAPSTSQDDQRPLEEDERSRARGVGGPATYSERLDSPTSLLANGRGPILDSKGKPLRPFTLLDQRQRVQDGVFRPDHSLPTMTIDEYLEEERRRGGIISGGGPQSGQREVVDEDDMERADAETMKARKWDDYVEDNPRGSGNTMNLG